MTGDTPNYTEWRLQSLLAAHEIAVLMHGFEPRALTDVTVQDPDDPTSPHGVPLDTSWEERALISAVATGDLMSVPAGVQTPSGSTKVLVSSLIPWLRKKGYGALADELDTPMPPTVVQSPQQPLQPHPPASAAALPPAALDEPARRLAALRALGGDAKWKHYRGTMQWRFTKIVDLCSQEKQERRQRVDVKTIRSDLRKAAEEERLSQRAGNLI